MNSTNLTPSQEMQRAADAIRKVTTEPWRALIVLGSGLGSLADQVKNPVRVSYADIPGFARSTVAGHSGQYVIGEFCGKHVAMMQGRVHFYEGHPMSQVVLPIRVARAMGADTLIITNAAGGIHRSFEVADVMLINDHINFIGMAGNNPLIGPNDDALGPRFPAMTTAYDAELRERARASARARGITLREGVYVGLAGPFFETPAEVRFLRTIGADAVGMSTVNEVVAARHMSMRVLGFSGITNVARLSADEGAPPTHEEVMEAAPKMGPKLTAIVQDVVTSL